MMKNFDEDPLDLLDDDGDGVIETCLFFDEDKKKKQSGEKPPGNGGCCVVLGVGASLFVAGWGVTKLLS